MSTPDQAHQCYYGDSALQSGSNMHYTAAGECLCGLQRKVVVYAGLMPYQHCHGSVACSLAATCITLLQGLQVGACSD